MPLNFLKKSVAGKAPEPRQERSRVDDRFERHLRVALRDHPVEVRGPVVLNDVLAMVVQAGDTQGTLQKIAQLRLDFELFDRQSQTPVVGIILSSRSYGRDRRRAPAAAAEPDSGRAIISVLHLNPSRLTDVLSIRETLRAYLPD
ncbi:hypothetical protein [Deinococcus radiotolerans]|uniref:Uncharacterized protein n=1 Tax=Deinococcus radiotolerans TaxID=1309407 RepID=A0ABQ2FJA7_9DEIO|nr:hypothetical protein [Deinococcus radiotolerans]GGL00241.1 hypothetical protein GCM10010844_18350 [Deinococcus radiotolerans]